MEVRGGCIWATCPLISSFCYRGLLIEEDTPKPKALCPRGWHIDYPEGKAEMWKHKTELIFSAVLLSVIYLTDFPWTPWRLEKA